MMVTTSDKSAWSAWCDENPKAVDLIRIMAFGAAVARTEREVTIADVDVLALLELRIFEAGTAAEWAETHGISQSHVSDVRSGRRAPGEAILDALGLERVVLHRRRA